LPFLKPYGIIGFNMMNKAVVLIGVGEMAGVFARGLLKMGYPVIPVTRQMNIMEVAQNASDPEAVIVAVGEKDLQAILKTIPKSWQDRLILLQNELLPRDWNSLIKNPTVISVWFEKKPGQDYKVLIASPVFGPHAKLIESALTSIKIPCRILNNEEELLKELVLKNLYILTINISGLVVGGTTDELWKNHQNLAREVANDVLDIQEWLTGKKFNRDELLQGMLKAFDGDPQHKCLGRTAAARLERAIEQADQAGLPVKRLREIAQKVANK
jgi:hypothetical protein